MASDDFVFALEGASSPAGDFSLYRVVRFVGEEEMSRPFRYEVHLLAPASAEDLDPEALVGKRACLRIATQSKPDLRLVHGIVTEAEDVADLPEGALFRIVLSPPLARAAHRTRCRVFVDKTLRQIVETVLKADAGMALRSGAPLPAPSGGASYEPAKEEFAWRVSGAARLDDLKARPYVVQYGESDLDFVSRLLEDEGIAYHFEHGDDVCLLVLSDADAGRPRVDDDDDVLGAGIDGREVSRFRLGGSLRASRVRLGEYSWERPALDLVSEAKDPGEGELTEYVFPGGYGEDAKRGEPLAKARLDRLHTEATRASGEGSVRVLSAGSVFRLEHKKSRYEGEYLVTRLEVLGQQAGALSIATFGPDEKPFEARFECACRGRGSEVEESRFRPARRTPKPRIGGAQTAFVTAEPPASGAEVNIGGPSQIGCVRLRFHWDKDEARLAKEPSSAWVRVSEPFARAGHGGVWHPRVGTEVVVEFEEGDPDRPVVTGRVYNGRNRPPKTAPTHSTFYSFSTPGGGKHNEITFEDTAGSERIYTNASRDMTANVNADRLENVGGDALMTVGGSNLEQIGGSQSTTVGANDSLAVGANQAKAIGASRSRIIGGNRSKLVGGTETRATAANHVNLVGGALTEQVGGPVAETYGATRSTTIAGDWTEHFGATRSHEVAGPVVQSYAGNQTTLVSGPRTVSVGSMLGVLVGGDIKTTIAGSHTVNIAAVRVHVAGGPITNQAPNLDVNAPLKLDLTAFHFTLFALKGAAYGSYSTRTALSLSAHGIKTEVGGVALSNGSVRGQIKGPEPASAGVEIKAFGILVKPSGIHVHP